MLTRYLKETATVSEIKLPDVSCVCQFYKEFIMNKLFIIIFAFLLFCGILAATNHLDIMTSMQGAHNTSYFGSTMATLDFNHDGFDDLIVCSPEWKSVYPAPMDWPKGKVDIYFGGSDFDNVPDITMEGQYDFQYKSVVNIGDVNGDGFDDLYINGDEPTANPIEHYLRIYTGGDTVPTEPDIMISYTLETNYYVAKVTPLGDINGDNYDDIGFSIGTPNLAEIFYIMLGNSFERQYITTSSDFSDSYTTGFNGIGDINHDGYDDFAIGYTNEDPNIGYHLITIYFGNATGSSDNQMVLTQTQTGISKISTPLGDLNGDGFADFMGYQSIAGLNVWLGSTETDSIPNFALNPAWQGDEFGQCLKYGDLNNDGFDDVVGTNYYQNAFRIWLGRAQPNGDSDLLINAPYIPANLLDYFGYGLTMGDYNGDDCCDIAISAPFTDNTLLPDYRGYVYVYAGNTQLADTTVGINDPLTPPVTNQFDMSISPNPARITDRYISVKLRNVSNNDKSLIDISIYNIRGQCMQKIHSDKTAISDTYSMDISKMASGVYLCQVKQGNRAEVKKISFIR